MSARLALDPEDQSGAGFGPAALGRVRWVARRAPPGWHAFCRSGRIECPAGSRLEPDGRELRNPVSRAGIHQQQQRCVLSADIPVWLN